MPLLDLTHPIAAGMPVYPGTEGPELIPACTLEKDGFAEKLLRFYSHTGTHMDAPSHLLQGGRHLDSYPVEAFRGTGCCVDLRDLAGVEIEIGLPELRPCSEAIASSDFLLLNTGWSDRWGEDAYFEQHPVLTPDAARWLCGFGLKAIGLDNISADRFDTRDFPVHKTLLGSGILIIENLTGLNRLPRQGFQLTCLPLKIGEADGAPVRAVADF